MMTIYVKYFLHRAQRFDTRRTISNKIASKILDKEEGAYRNISLDKNPSEFSLVS